MHHKPHITDSLDGLEHVGRTQQGHGKGNDGTEETGEDQDVIDEARGGDMGTFLSAQGRRQGRRLMGASCSYGARIVS
jgi:hypothetical protein